MSARDFLSTPKPSGRSLPDSLVNLLSDFLDAQEIVEGEVVRALAVEDFVAMYNEAADAPSEFTRALLCAWVRDDPVVADRSGNEGNGDAQGGNRLRNIPPPTSLVNRAGDQQTRDESAMNLSGKEITALDASFHCGSLVDVAEIEDEKYGSDPATTAIAIAKRKAKSGDTLPELLTKGDANGVRELLTVLIRDHNLLGMPSQVSVLTAFKTETDDVYGDDAKGWLEYIRRYRKKYRGRAFPVSIDYALVIKGLKAADNSSLREQMLSLKKELDEARKLAKEAFVACEKLKGQVASIKGGPRHTSGDRPVPENFKCKKCGVVGDHWTDRCPLGASKKDDEEKKDD